MEQYETQTMCFKAINYFIKQFNKKVGTEFDLNNPDLDQYYVMCFDLTKSDVKICRQIEDEALQGVSV